MEKIDYIAIIMDKKIRSKKPNRLINEKSPYLKQHAYNPVDWYPWCEEAFEKAKKEYKPIFLSIGYSTCHWCHVMEKESFEDKEVAEILNKYFVPIKVDREERPDIDNIYMNVCIMMTKNGGWPLTVFLNPDKSPFFAGTYFPKESRYGRIGLKDLLIKIAQLWEKDRYSLLNQSEIVMKHLKEYAYSHSKGDLKPDILDISYKEFKKIFDPHHGGFGNRPKFPSPHNFLFLLRYYFRTRIKDALYMVEHSLKNMRLGGIFDHIGYGFHRYSTDERWFLPHFEKMLYDQALLTIAYAETYQLTKKAFYRKVVDEILEYVKRDMTDEESGFYSAEDADSEGEEGKFYVWSYYEIKEILNKDFPLAEKVFLIKREGNYREEATGKASGKNILHMKKPYKELAKDIGITEKELIEKISKIRKKLFEIRKERTQPSKDKKILTDWNGLMIAAFSIVSQVLCSKEYAQIAKKAADFIISKMKTKEDILLHRYKDREARFHGNINDYAFFIWGLIELYYAIFEEKYLKEAVFLTDEMIRYFWDKRNGGFFMSPDFGKDLIIRPKEISDGAIPSGNSVAIYNLFRLYKITGNDKYKNYGIKAIKSFSGNIKNSPHAYPMMLLAYDSYISDGIEIILAGKKENIKEFIEELYSHYLPHKTVILKERESLSEIVPYTKSIPVPQDGVNAYVCKNFTCQMPLTNVKEFRKSISSLYQTR